MELNQQIPCREVHVINGIVPKPEDTQYDQAVCDCGRLQFYLEKCGCPANVTPTYTLKSRENSGFIPK